MIKIDLITGFLGSGKTTFIRKYVEYLTQRGIHTGIIENDFGAINVDMLMLQDLEGEYCDVEQIVGGNVVSDWKRRFKAKLISLSMQGFKRVVVEPSGIYDVEAFFDVLYDEPVNSWYEIGNIITIVDSGMDSRLTEQAEYLMVSQLANSGMVVLSKMHPLAETDDFVGQVKQNIEMLNVMLNKYECDRNICSSDILAKDWKELTDGDYERIINCGWKNATYKKLMFDNNDVFKSLFFMNVNIMQSKIENCVKEIFSDSECGTIFRVKGFFKHTDGKWLEVNATKSHIEIKTIKTGQEVIIVIGQNMNEEHIRLHLDNAAN